MSGIGDRVWEARLLAGMTQEELADAVGLGRTSITNIEYGRQTVSIAKAEMLAQALSVHPAWLAGWRKTKR